QRTPWHLLHLISISCNKHVELVMFSGDWNNFLNMRIILDKRGRGPLLLRNGNTDWPRLPAAVSMQPRVGSTGICVFWPNDLTRGHVCLLLAYPTFMDRRALPEDLGAAQDRGTPAEEDTTLAAIVSTRHRVDVLSDLTPQHTRHGPRNVNVPLRP